MRIAIVDCGAGNLTSVMRMVEHVGADPHTARVPEQVMEADRVILPGVGAAGEAMAKLRERGLDEALDLVVRRQGKPMLGICLGMQLLAETLTEFGERPGLGWIPARVEPLSALIAPGARVPHMGWSDISVEERAAPLFTTVRFPRQFYFAHSFALVPAPLARDRVAAVADHGGPIVAALLWDNIFATQFHPEKSQINGEDLMAAFLDWEP